MPPPQELPHVDRRSAAVPKNALVPLRVPIAASGHPLRVALLDCHALSRALLVDALDELDAPVVLAESNPNAFIDALGSSTANVCLVEPVLDPAGLAYEPGLCVLQELQARAPRLPVVVLTRCADPRAIERCCEAGAMAFLWEPLASLEQLLLALRMAVRGERHFPLELFQQVRCASPSMAGAELLGRLTAREREVFRLLAAGSGNPAIARQMGISVRTAKGHVAAIYRKLGIRDRMQLVLRAHELGMGGQAARQR